MKFESIQQLDNYNFTQKDTNLHIIGDRAIISEVVQLLAYIRHALNNNEQTKIVVDVKNTIANPNFSFDVNSMQIPDLTTKDHIQIN